MCVTNVTNLGHDIELTFLELKNLLFQVVENVLFDTH